MLTINKDDLEGMGPCVGVTVKGINQANSIMKQLLKAGCFVAIFPYPMNQFRIITKQDSKTILESILDGFRRF